ncbi:LOW QUALITY PROTEIN: protein TEX261 [Coturnix japonica]|uniref:LOW QUALITY PROTEIN: protein TEX261 n=1 Tax=Coturnix japonica TaxID=93934 RepID=UPI0007781255|nr:LOW QUALITY PROTEIN: protein TEX261 [Coturnix japonica]
MWFLYALSWLSLLLQVAFVTLAIAAGLYYLAELVEEYTVVTRRIIKYMIWGPYGGTMGHYGDTLGTHWGPQWDTQGGIGVLGVTLGPHWFPMVPLWSPLVPYGAIMVPIVSLWCHCGPHWFPMVPLWSPLVLYGATPPQVLAYFTFCLWLIPFSFFVSLSAGENVLPSTVQPGDDVVSNSYCRGSALSASGLLAVFSLMRDAVLPEAKIPSLTPPIKPLWNPPHPHQGVTLESPPSTYRMGGGVTAEPPPSTHNIWGGA